MVALSHCLRMVERPNTETPGKQNLDFPVHQEVLMSYTACRKCVVRMMDIHTIHWTYDAARFILLTVDGRKQEQGKEERHEEGSSNYRSITRNWKSRSRAPRQRWLGRGRQLCEQRTGSRGRRFEY